MKAIATLACLMMVAWLLPGCGGSPEGGAQSKPGEGSATEGMRDIRDRARVAAGQQ